jgi:hypothetical protein
LKYTKEESKLGISTNYLKDKKKNLIKAPIIKGVKKNLCNVVNTFYKDQSRNNLLMSSSQNKTSTSKIFGSAFATNSNIVQPVSFSTLPPLSLSPTRSGIDMTAEPSPQPLSKREIEHTMRSVRFDASTLSPCFDHIYKSFHNPQSPLLSNISSQWTLTQSPPRLRKPIKLQVLKPAHSLILKHRSEYEVDADKKCNFEVMYEQYQLDRKLGNFLINNSYRKRRNSKERGGRAKEVRGGEEACEEVEED